MGARRARVHIPPADGERLFFGKWEDVPPHVPVLWPAFIPALASISPATFKKRKWKEREERIAKGGAVLTFRDKALAPKIGPFAVKTLLLAYGAFTARPHGLTQGSVRSDALSFSVPLWDAAMLFGVPGIGRNLQRGKDEEGKDLARTATARINNFQRRIRTALRLLSSIAVSIGQETVPLISKSSTARDGSISFALPPAVALSLAKSGTAQVAASLFALDGKERTAFSLGLKIAAFVSIRRNHAGGRNPDRLRVKSLLEATPLPPIGAVGESGKTLRSAKGWRAWTQAPFERAMDRLTGGRFLSSWEYAPAKRGKAMKDGKAGNGGEAVKVDGLDFQKADEWRGAMVVFVLSSPPKILPPRRREKKEKEKPDESV